MQKQKRPPLILRALFIIGFCSIGSMAAAKASTPFLVLLGWFLLESLAILIWPDRFGTPESVPS